MRRMLAELNDQPELGLLHAHFLPGFRVLSVMQYWRSFEALEAYAHARDHLHLPAWVTFNRLAAKSDAVGIWHETYRIRAGEYENIYRFMPPYGLGRAGTLRPATGARRRARGRLHIAQAAEDADAAGPLENAPLTMEK